MRFELPEKKRLVHEMVIPIRWGDMDVMGHVNNTSYFRYFEIVRLAWYGSLGRKLLPEGECIVPVNAFCTFHKQLEYPGDVVAKMYTSDPGQTSFETWATLERVDDPGVIYASGGATTVWVDFLKGTPVPLPGWLRAVVE